jgi:hypothetical protein
MRILILLALLIAGCGGTVASSSDEKALEWERTEGKKQRDRLEGGQP